MYIYFFLFFTLAVLAFLCKLKSEERTLAFFMLLCWVLLSLVEGIRSYDVGTDTMVYVNSFTGKSSIRNELGYRIIAETVKLLSSDPTVLLLVIAFLINGLVLIAIYINSHTPVESVLLYVMMYYYFNTYNVARQYIAVAITLIAFYFAVRHRWLYFVSMIALAMCFHSTSLVCLVLAAVGFVYSKEDSNTLLQTNGLYAIDCRKRAMRIQTIVVLLTIIGSCICYFCLDWLIAIAVKIFPKYAYYLSGPESYLLEEGGGISQPVVYTSILVAMLIFVPAENKCKRMLLVPACVAVLFSFLQMRVLHAARFLWYFDIYSIMTIPCIVKYGIFPQKIRRIFMIAVSIVCFAFMTYYLSVDMQGVKNYSFVFTT